MADAEQYFQAERAHINASGLFLAPWYGQRHPELEASGIDTLAYFCSQGWRLGDQPNPYFDPVFYGQANPDVARAGVNPLLHYALHGDKEGRNPSPWFDVAWYRNTYQVPAGQTALKHFLDRRHTGQVSPVPIFDAAFYLESNPDVANSGADPFEHFLTFGAAENRDPAPDFDVKFYNSRYGAALNGQNPLLHYLANRNAGGFLPARPEHEKLIPGAVKTATRPSPYFEEFRPIPRAAPRLAKLLAYYLPQFHAVPENDAWWGKGFTDWTNLGRALPRFAGHLQPRVPRDLGFYDLASPETLRKQIELARGAGIHGFVFYHYWFNGMRLLDGPLNQLLADADQQFPFCVMWANENFTRRWDGLEREVLLTQEYRDADDAALIAGFAALFADARYIRIDNRPLLMIYRASLIPDAAKRIASWRKIFQGAHSENPIIIMAQSLGDYDPTPYGLDGAVEFPPHKLSDEIPKINDRLDLFDPEFTAGVYEYQDIADASAAAPMPDYPLIKTIVPGWDNDPRREGRGLVLAGASPPKYQAWLEKLVARAAKNLFFSEKIVCVNAWNEWAEGAFLEPDIHFGAAFLNATGRAICAGAAHTRAAILLVGHDAQPHGAQMLLLHLARHYARVCGFDVHVLLLGAGPLVAEYQKTATVTLTADKAAIARLIDQSHAAGIRTVLVNSAASARLVPALMERGMNVTLLIHEMPRLLAEYNLQVQARLGIQAATRVVFASRFVHRQVTDALQTRRDDAVILPQGNYQKIGFSAAARAATRTRLGIADGAFAVLGLGFADLRKGFDLFVQMARAVLAQRADVHFIWAGEIQPAIKTYLGPEIEAAQTTGRFHLPGFTAAPADFFAAADVFALPSREDPYPTVALEALAVGIPVVAFEESGGIPDLIRAHHAGAVAAVSDTADFRKKLLSLLNQVKLQAERPRLAAIAAQAFSQTAYANNLLRAARPDLKTVSVCVLNYNYARFLRLRLDSIFGQTYPVAEVLFFDDASADDSVVLAGQIAQAAKREMPVIANAHNAGAVFAQWRRAAEMASGDYIWLAEADDSAAPDFISRVMEAIAAADDAVLGFSDSRIIDDAGRMTAPSYQPQYEQAGATALAGSGTWAGRDFAESFLAVQNLMFNVSAVIWRRDSLLAALDRIGEELAGYRLAGDWRLYLEVLAAGEGEIAYVAESLNMHRRHGGSTTATLEPDRHEAEIHALHQVAGRLLNLSLACKKLQTAYLKRIKNKLMMTLPRKSSRA